MNNTTYYSFPTANCPVNLIGMNCSGMGLTRNVTRAILVSPLEIGQPNKHGALRLVAANNGVHGAMVHIKSSGNTEMLHLKALDSEGNLSGNMMSGLYAANSDSRFPFSTPVPVHSRVE